MRLLLLLLLEATGQAGLWAGLAGFDLSWLMEGAGPALGERGDSRLSTSMMVEAALSAHVAPSRGASFDWLLLTAAAPLRWDRAALGWIG